PLGSAPTRSPTARRAASTMAPPRRDAGNTPPGRETGARRADDTAVATCSGTCMPVGPSRCAHPSPSAGTSPRTLATSNVMLSEGTEQSCGRRRWSAQETVRGAGRALRADGWRMGSMSEAPSGPSAGDQVMVVGPDGQPVGTVRMPAREDGDGDGEVVEDSAQEAENSEDLSGAVEEPAK